MNKVVFFTDLQKLPDALNNFDMKSFAGKRVPVKLHMGEVRNKYFTKPDFVKMVVDEFKKVNVDPFLFDTTVAYPGLRHYVSGYQQVARLHGYTMKKIGCDIIIDDSGVIKTVENRDFEVAWHLVNSSHIVAITHVKGHIQTGFGGAIKNFGMGGVTKETKKKMHYGSRPIFNKDKCTYCGVCAEVCPFEAIKVNKKNWNRNKRTCFGCGVCINACKNKAITYEDADLQYLLALSAKACLQGKKVLYINELKRIAKSCDCDPFPGPTVVPDIGYLVADDPVAIDKASLDLINKVKKDVFLKENKIDPFKQIKYGEEIGLGFSSYQLIEL